MRALFVLVAAAFLLPALSSVVHAANRPNVIVIFTDDQGYADLSSQGVLDDVKTPNMDLLAAGGVRMTSGYVTAPQCVPSRAGLLTGRYQNRFGIETPDSDRTGFINQETIAERLKKAGYATGMVGKWGLGNPAKIQSHGFDDVYQKRGELVGWANYDLEGNDVEPGPEKSGLYHIDAGSAAARAFIKRHHKEPFFLYLAYRAPHRPLDATQKYLDRFPEEIPETRRQALAMLSAVDDGVGGALETLRKYGIEERTLIFLISDNGAALKTFSNPPGVGSNGSLNDPLNGEKGTLMEGGTRVPFVVYWKGSIPAGQVYDQPVISLDVAATAVALAGLPDDPQLDGVNLIPYLRGEKAGAPHAMLFWAWGGQAAVRKGKWKYLSGDSRRYLFNLESDLAEQENLIASHPRLASRLEARLIKWASRLDPPGLTQELGPVGSAHFDHYLDKKGKDSLDLNSQ